MKISQTEQVKVLGYIKETFNNYVQLSANDRERLLNIFEWYSTFTQKKSAEWSSSFKVNKAHEIVNKILPRIIAKNPRWLVNPRTDEFAPEDKFLQWEERQKRMEQMSEMAKGIQDYLSYIFDRYNLREPLRLWAKSMLMYGNSYAKIKYKYETTRIKDENGKITEKITGEYPTIDPKSWADIYIDPRYVLLEDMPCIFEVVNGVRFWDLKRKKNKYINLDKIELLPDMWAFKETPDSYKQKLFEITGIPSTDITNGVDKDALTLKTFYWVYEFDTWEWEDDEVEKLYKITTVDDLFIIEFEEILELPFEDIKAFDNPEVHYAVWFVEPILSIQDELNFKKNSASEYINNALNRSWLWSPNSWVDPRDLISRPNNIIVTSKDAITAQNNLVELPHRQLTTDYFQEQNDLERQIQGQTFTVDTSSQKSEQALTNTATGIRVKFFESNSVIDEIRKHFEEWLERLAYKLLQSTFDNMEDNIVIKKLGDAWYWEMNKELFRDAITRYSIKIEVNSSSYDDIESRREDAIAFGNIMWLALQQWVPVNMPEVYKDIINTFEKKDINRFIKPEWVESMVWNLWWWTIPAPIPWQNPTASLTEAVAKWWITTWL